MSKESQTREYEVIEAPQIDRAAESKQKINAMAADGYRLVETIENNGTTMCFVFEREV